MTKLEEIALAIDRVNAVFSSSAITGNKLCWVIWDQNKGEIHQDGCVFIGRECVAGDDLEKPYGEIFWKLKDFKGRAAVEAMREPSEAMMRAFSDAAYENCYEMGDTPDQPAGYRAMIDAILNEKPE